MSLQRLEQILNETPSDVLVVCLHPVSELRCYDALLVRFYDVFKLRCQDIQLVVSLNPNRSSCYTSILKSNTIFFEYQPKETQEK